MNITIPTIVPLAVAALVSFAFGPVAALIVVAVLFVVGLVASLWLTAIVCSDDSLGSGSTGKQVAAMLIMNAMQTSLGTDGRCDVAFLGASARETQLLERLRRSPAYSFLSNTVSVIGPIPVFPGYLIVSAMTR